jgi:protein-S-isoprenylcysteine O-methyltransferase Ste14
MKLLDWVVAVVLFLQLPVPLYWLILHPQVGFWRKHVRAGHWVAGLSAWGIVTVFLYVFRERLFSTEHSPVWAIAAGLILMAVDPYVLYRAQRDLGSARLVGHTELEGGGELATHGMYSRMRHPRYTAMMFAVLGACLVGGSPTLWGVAAVWWLLALAAIGLEERELRARFGEAYLAYSKRVPRFLPFDFRAHKD